MKLRDVLVFALAGTAIVLTSCAGHRANQTAAKSEAVTRPVAVKSPAPVTTPPVYVPDTSHANDPLPDGVLAWNSLRQSTNVSAEATQAHFTLSFTNTSSGPVSILNVHPSCGCTTAKLPSLPWTISAGDSGVIPVTVNVEGKQGTLFKSVKIATDKGSKDLFLQITIEPIKIPAMTAEERARFVKVATADRQAVFKGNCVTCHVKHGEGKYGMALYQADCAICHEAKPRATMVPDLHDLKVPTNPDFWKQWIAHGKPGTLMPAFSKSEGGPLTDMQIASLSVYLNYTNPSKVPQPR